MQSLWRYNIETILAYISSDAVTEDALSRQESFDNLPEVPGSVTLDAEVNNVPNRPAMVEMEEKDGSGVPQDEMVFTQDEHQAGNNDLDTVTASSRRASQLESTTFRWRHRVVARPPGLELTKKDCDKEDVTVPVGESACYNWQRLPATWMSCLY